MAGPVGQTAVRHQRSPPNGALFKFFSPEFGPMTQLSPKPCTLHHSVLQEFQGADTSAGREPAGLQRGPQGEASEEEGAQAEDHPGGRGGHRAGAAEQGADGAVA